jgi:ADP-dependent NAD(P)H-hydrate dehydratase
MRERAPVDIDDALLARWPLPEPEADGDKESRGRVLVIAGSREIAGAAVLAATAALRAGAGKLVIATPQSAWQTIALAVPEARVIALPESAAGGPLPEGLALLASCAADTAAVLAGPGMMDAEATTAFVTGLLPMFRGSTVVLDALAMDCVRGGASFAQPVVLLPHAGEMAHLTGEAKDEVRARPQEFAARHAAAWGATVALKGALTCIAHPGGELWRHECALPGLGTSGSGDVLAGLVAGLAARGAAPEQAAVWGVALHARAGHQLSRAHGAVGYLARELIAELPALMARH